MYESRKHGKEFHEPNELNDVTKENTKKNKNKDRCVQALDLPIICNLNPRSIYNKVEEFSTFVKEEQADLIFLSESWERDYLTLDQIIKLEEHTIIPM